MSIKTITTWVVAEWVVDEMADERCFKTGIRYSDGRIEDAEFKTYAEAEGHLSRLYREHPNKKFRVFKSIRPDGIIKLSDLLK